MLCLLLLLLYHICIYQIQNGCSGVSKYQPKSGQIVPPNNTLLDATPDSNKQSLYLKADINEWVLTLSNQHFFFFQGTLFGHMVRAFS